MSSKYAVIFDMDGVLVDSEYYYLKQNQKYIESRGKIVNEKDLYRVVGTPMQVTYEMIYEYFKDEWSFEYFKNDFDSFLKTIECDYSKIINPTVVETLEYLRNNGFKIGLASSCDMPNIQKVLDQTKLRDYFSVVLSGDSFAMSKPHPEIYCTCADMLGITPNHCFVVEDSVYGIEAGKRAGMTVFAYKQPFGHDQSKADYFVDKIDGILPIIRQLIHV